MGNSIAPEHTLFYFGDELHVVKDLVFAALPLRDGDWVREQ
jgi:hypothetical protein